MIFARLLTPIRSITTKSLRLQPAYPSGPEAGAFAATGSEFESIARYHYADNVNESTTGYAEITLHLRWGDMDINKHVNNVQFARLFEEARVRSMSVWFDGRAWGAGAFHIARQEIEFVAPLLYSTEPSTARVWISRVGTSSFDFGAELRDSGGDLKAFCETTCVTVNSETGTSRPIPEEVRDLLRSKLADPVPFRRRS